MFRRHTNPPSQDVVDAVRNAVNKDVAKVYGDTGTIGTGDQADATAVQTAAEARLGRTITDDEFGAAVLAAGWTPLGDIIADV